MYKTIKDKIGRDKDYPPRQFDINVLTRVLEGEIYDHLEYDFSQERKDGLTGEYILLNQRRPSVRYALCRIVVDDSVSLLFSEGHFPSIACKDEPTRDKLTALIKEANLNEVMIAAATTGSVGSVAILMRVLKNRVFFSVFNTQYLTPTWKADAPDTLESVAEQYKVKGSVLKASGYAIDDAKLTVDHWFRREWTEAAETWFIPVEVPAQPSAIAWVKDATKSTPHSLGFVPMVWVKNLPGGNGIDGRPTFPVEVINTQIEIDYQLSQAGRGLKYSSDPTLLLKEPAMDNDGQMVKGGGNALIVGKEGDAKLLEIGGTAAQAVIDYVKSLRDFALESAHGNRSNADKLSAAQSGRAMELMMQSLIWLADKLRINYGEGALLELLNMVAKASQKFDLVMKDGTKLEKLSTAEPVTLRWPAWFALTHADKQTQAETMATLRDKGLISQQTAVKTIAPGYDIEDPEDEIRQIEIDGPPPDAKPEPTPAKPNPGSDD